MDHQEQEILDIQELKRKLISIDWTSHDVDDITRRLLLSYNGNQSDWSQYCSKGNKRYSRTSIYSDENFTLLLLCFKPQSGNKIHNHGEAKCWFKVLKGQLIEKHYRYPEQYGPMNWNVKNKYETNEMNQSAALKYLHCCRNTSFNETAVSLVLYYPPIQNCLTFDDLTGKQQEADLTIDSPDQSTSLSSTYWIFSLLLLLLMTYLISVHIIVIGCILITFSLKLISSVNKRRRAIDGFVKSDFDDL